MRTHRKESVSKYFNTKRDARIRRLREAVATRKNKVKKIGRNGSVGRALGC